MQVLCVFVFDVDCLVVLTCSWVLLVWCFFLFILIYMLLLDCLLVVGVVYNLFEVFWYSHCLLWDLVWVTCDFDTMFCW